MKNKYTKTKEIKKLSNGKIDWKYFHSKSGWKTVKNPHYIKVKRPHTCNHIPGAECLKNKCKFFLWSDVSKETVVKRKRVMVGEKEEK